MSQSQEILSAREQLTAQILNDLHEKWTPHPSQVKVLNAIFYQGMKNIFCECGRKFGKTEIAVYFLVRYALLHPNSANYLIEPYLKQAKEILWAQGRLENFIPRKYIKSVNHTELRITLTNGSHIKLEGAENVEAYRGVTPHALVADEIAQHDERFWTAMMPNRAVHNAPLLVIGTPPETEGFSTKLKNDTLKRPNSIYFNFSSYANPHISKEWLDSERDTLIGRGDEDIWMREYMAKFVRGGKNAIFPAFNPDKHILKPEVLAEKIKRDQHKLWFYAIADPGSTSVFGVLFVAFNQFKKEWFVFDEIYETEQSKTSVNLIHERIEKVIMKYPASRWYHIYDEAAAWFWTEISQYEPYRSWSPTAKASMKRDPATKEPWGLSIIKDAFRFDRIFISENCPKLRWEIENYARSHNRSGDVKIYKRNDHLIDCLRYGFYDANYNLSELKEPDPEPWKPRRKVFTIEQDMKAGRWYD